MDQVPRSWSSMLADAGEGHHGGAVAPYIGDNFSRINVGTIVDHTHFAATVRPTRRNTLFPVSRLSLSTAGRSVGVL